MNIAIYTLGCKVNQYETQAIEAELRRRGHDLVDFDGPADAYIINTCTVTAVSDHKCRQAIRRSQKRSPGAVVAVCGCYAQTAPQDVAALGVDLVGGANRRLAFLDDLEALMAARRGTPAAADNIMSTEEQKEDSSPSEGPGELSQRDVKVTVDNIMSTRAFEELPAGGLEGRTRAMLKVEDGCVNFCTYCIIPYARGPVRSLSIERTAAEARRLMEAGYKELVVTGIEISSWGQDLRDGTGLIDLLEAICAAAPACRIRLGSLEPRTVTEDFCRRASSLHNLDPHFHLSLQSGCDATLKRMNRKYDTTRFLESVRLLRTWFDRPGITADLIVGFPGESEEDFRTTVAFIHTCAFSDMHIFPYSRRPGTPADKMPGQISRRVKEERSRIAIQAAREESEAYRRSWVGQTLPVLFEEVKGGLYRGYAPNYVDVFVSSPESLHNTEGQVRITGLTGDGLLGELLP